MAQITDEGIKWRLDLHQDAVVQYDSIGNVDPETMFQSPDKTYHALLGVDPQTERYVIKSVWYDKSKYAIGDVIKLIDDMKNCAKCDTLDRQRLKELHIETAGRPEQYQDYVNNSMTQPTHNSPGVTSPPGGPAFHQNNFGGRGVDTSYGNPVPVPEPSQANTPTAMDMYMEAMFNAYLTSAGKLMWGNVFGDKKLVDSVYPNSVEEMAQLIEDVNSGKLLRNPEEAKEFFAAIQTDKQTDGNTAGGKPNVKRTKGIVIY